MKRGIRLTIVVIVLLSVLLVGCGKGNEGENGDTDENVAVEGLQDGRYLIKSPVSEQGVFGMATMEVSDGEISSFKYAEILADSGEEKNESNYKYPEGLQVIENLNNQFNQKKDLDDIDYDAVSGATHTKGSFRQAVNELLTQSKDGKGYNPKYKDGEYTDKAEEDSHGWLGEAAIIVREGQIVGIEYFELAIEDMESNKLVFDEDDEPLMDSDGKPKTEMVEVKAGQKKSADNYAHLVAFDVIKGVQKLVIDNNGIENLNVDSVTGATSTRTTMVELIEKGLEKAK